VFLAVPFERASGQVVALYDVIYRPPGVKYRVISSGSQEVIYQEGRRDQAFEILSTIRQTNPATGLLLGVDGDFKFSVVLNDFSDSGNGYVTPFPFKSEIEGVALRGRGLSRTHTSWTQVVVTHEMVHAAQAEFETRKSLVGLIRFFSPDFARAIGLFVPPGFTEGLAVFRESQVPAGAGRLNHSFFLMQARAGISGADGWNLSQMLEVPSYTRPFDRFYKGGALFTQFFLQTYGKAGTQRILRWQQHVPFLGFGANLRYAAKESPRRVGTRFQEWFSEKEDALVQSLGTLSTAAEVSAKKGQIHRRPKWITDSTWIAFAFGYDLSRGFHVFTDDGSRKRISRNEISDDAVYFRESNSSDILYARYEEHPLAYSSKTSSVFRLNTATGKETRVFGSDHTYNPISLGNGDVYAIHSDGQYNEIVQIGAGNSRKPILRFEQSDFVSMEPRPGSDSLAVIVNVKGVQSVFLIDTAKTSWTLTPWIGFPSSTIYDGSWNASGRYFSFTSDRTGILNVYVLDAWTEQITRVTNVRFAAMEGQVSPDGRQLVFVEYQDERFDLMTKSLSGPFQESVSRDEANFVWTTDWNEQLSAPRNQFSEELETEERAYRAVGRVKPRMIYPTLYLDPDRNTSSDARLGFGIGVAMQGTDPLQKLAYHAEGILQKNRLWGEVGIQSGHFAFRPSVTLERRPQTVNAIIAGSNVITRVVRDRTNLDISAFLPYTFNQNVDRTSFVSAVTLSSRSERYLDDDLKEIQSRSNQLSLIPAAFYGRKVLRSPRDILPSSGQTLSWFGDFELSNDAGDTRYAWALLGNVYVPLLSRFNTSIRLNAGVLRQNNPSVFGLTFFKPVGWDRAFLDSDTFVRYGAKVVQPVFFPDNGWVTIPVFMRTVYLFSFAEHLPRREALGGNISSVGGGIGIRFRLLHYFDFDLSYTAAYRIQDRSWESLWDVYNER